MSGIRRVGGGALRKLDADHRPPLKRGVRFSRATRRPLLNHKLCLSSSAKFRGPAKPLAHVGDFVPAGAARRDPFPSERRTAGKGALILRGAADPCRRAPFWYPERLRRRRRRGTKI